MSQYPTWKRYLVSASRLFLASFLLVITAQFQGIVESGGLLTADVLQAMLYSSYLSGAAAAMKFLHEKLSGYEKKLQEELGFSPEKK